MAKTNNCFSVNIQNSGNIQAGWNFGGIKGWSISKMENFQWVSEDLTKEGYESILSYFRLTEIGKCLPFKCLQRISPANLQSIRNNFEKGRDVNIPNLDPLSQRTGFTKVLASEVS
ncbi:hypothetical protein COB87_001780 [Candidatus Wolfebacteria bacterium]|nr:hypothetical protein [Candidatus Wolfebacteria bacterium]